jgi:HK97 family phage prohead protease
MKEIRTFVAQELRAAGSKEQPKVEGYAAVFNNVTNIGSFQEVIQRGAFKRSLAEGDDVVCLIDHNPSLILGRRSAGSLTLEEDDKGLKFSCALPDTTVARDAYANLKAGNLRECSFGFFVDSEDGETWTRNADGSMLRTLVSVRLFDCSIVTFPAYDNTSASARNVVSDHVEARMAALSADDDTAVRRARAEEVLAEIAAESDAELRLKAQASLYL